MPGSNWGGPGCKVGWAWGEGVQGDEEPEGGARHRVRGELLHHLAALVHLDRTYLNKDEKTAVDWLLWIWNCSCQQATKIIDLLPLLKLFHVYHSWENLLAYTPDPKITKLYNVDIDVDSYESKNFKKLIFRKVMSNANSFDTSQKSFWSLAKQFFLCTLYTHNKSYREKAK